VERVPEINAVGVEHVPPGALVRFRCMVQDMYNPEYYVGAYRDAGGRWRTTKYTEDLGPADLAGTHSPADSKIWERRVLYCVPVPGESAWVRRLDGAGVGAPPSTPAKISEDRAGKKDKRARDEDVEMDAADDADGGRRTRSPPRSPAPAPRRTRRLHVRLKRSETTRREPARQREGGDAVHVHPGGDASSEDALNLPLGTEKAAPGLLAATPCIVKMYDDEDDVKLNDVLELVGVLGIAPALAQEMQDMSAEPFGVFANRRRARRTRTAPRTPTPTRAWISSLWTRRARTTHQPPSCPGSTSSPRAEPRRRRFAIAARSAVDTRVARARSARSVAPGRWTAAGVCALWKAARSAAPGSSRQLASRVALRGAREAPGVPRRAPGRRRARRRVRAVRSAGARAHAQRRHAHRQVRGHAARRARRRGVLARARSRRRWRRTLAMLAPATAHLPLSIASLNARAWAPRKDYATNRLRSGPLQLASGTTLVLDETALSAGALNDRGVRNARALTDLATTQELEMDFSFHAMRVPTDVNVVAVSGSRTSGIVEGLDASVALRMTAEPRVPIIGCDSSSSDFEEPSRSHGTSSKTSQARFDAASLAEMRAFVARARSSSHAIGADAGARIESAMVAARASDPNATQETFHRWLTMARLAALARGETELKIEHWDRARECERLAAERARVC